MKPNDTPISVCPICCNTMIEQLKGKIAIKYHCPMCNHKSEVDIVTFAKEEDINNQKGNT